MVRYKHRYLLCEIIWEQNHLLVHSVTERDIYYTVRDAVQELHGDYGMGILLRSLTVKYVNPVTRVVLIRAQRGAHQMVQSAVACIKKIRQHEVAFRTLHLGGTIKSCEKFLLQHHRRELAGILAMCKTQEEKDEVEKSLLTSKLDLTHKKKEKRTPSKQKKDQSGE